MKPAVDEMFPEGAGPYVDLEEGAAAVCSWTSLPMRRQCTSTSSTTSKTCSMMTTYSDDAIRKAPWPLACVCLCACVRARHVCVCRAFCVCVYVCFQNHETKRQLSKPPCSQLC
ncbi:unnamed protein product [Gadus morhua 'NCC']